MAESQTHESFVREEAVKGSSDRAFAFVFVAVFALIGLAPLVHGNPLRIWSLAIAGVLLAVGLVRPQVLAPLNRLWTKLGLLLHRITNPIIMGVVFFLAVVPTGLIMKLMGKDPLHRKLDPEAPSYWVHRTPPGPPPDTMKNQF